MTAPQPRIFTSISHHNNMDVIRYLLALTVIIGHTAELCRADIFVPFRLDLAVGGFFALSGFLMFPTFEKRPTWRHYISRRAHRILPPYEFIVIACAIGFAAISTMSISNYFGDAGFWGYLAANLSFLNFFHPGLPGVFEDGRFVDSAVNGSLWTMKGEWACYLSVPIVYAMIRRCKKNRSLPLGLIILMLIVISAILHHLWIESNNRFIPIILKQFHGLAIYFFAGAFFNLYYERFIANKALILTLTIATVIIGHFDPTSFYYIAIEPIAVSFLVLYASLIGSWGTRIARHDNISYDMYLFHYPIIQLSVWLGLPLTLRPYTLLAVIVAATTLMATISWNAIGKRFYRTKS